MNEPLVSILIPCFNAEPWLRDAIESALAQTWRHKEIIVVNDGSTDRSLDIAHAFEPRGVQVIDQPNAGQSAAFNTGIRAARGEYLEFLDADDVLAPDKLAQQLQRLRTLPGKWVATGAWARFHGDVASVDFNAGPVARDLAPRDWLVALWRSHEMMHGAAWLIPATLVASAGEWNESLSLINDFEFFSRIVLATDGVAYCPAARSYYRSGVPGSLSGRKSAAAWRSAFESIRLGTERLLAAENSPRTRSASATAWRYLAFDCYPDMPDVSAAAQRQVHALGEPLGCPPGGRWFTLVSRTFGWKVARRLQRVRAVRLR